MSNEEIKIGSGNVFVDLGFSAQEAENLRIRSELMSQIIELMDRQEWSIEQAIVHFGISVETLEALRQGKIGQFSIDQLMMMLTHSGMQVRVEVLPAVA
jgi:predicted XRE-type DNA-binding protein